MKQEPIERHWRNQIPRYDNRKLGGWNWGVIGVAVFLVWFWVTVGWAVWERWGR